MPLKLQDDIELQLNLGVAYEFLYLLLYHQSSTDPRADSYKPSKPRP